MGLYNRAYLVCQESPAVENPSTAVFELRFTDYTETVTPKYLLGGNAQFVREFLQFTDDDLDWEVTDNLGERRTGYWQDGGAGDWQYTVEFEASQDALRWGDGESGTGPSNVTRTDASGEGVRPLTRLQVLQFWIAQTRSDSFSHTRLHIGEWTDGSYQDYRDGEYVTTEAGAYGTPIPVAFEEVPLQKKGDSTTTLTGTLNMTRVQPYPASEEDLADWAVENLTGLVSGGAGAGVGAVPDS